MVSFPAALYLFSHAGVGNWHYFLSRTHAEKKETDESTFSSLSIRHIRGVGWYFSFILQKILSGNGEYPIRYYAASDLGLHCLSIPLYFDARLVRGKIW